MSGYRHEHDVTRVIRVHNMGKYVENVDGGETRDNSTEREHNVFSRAEEKRKCIIAKML